MNKKTVFAIVATLVIGILVFIGLATADSCKRLDRPCFGNSTGK